MAATYQAILKDVQKGTLAPVYFFDGEEPFFIDKLLDFFEEQLIPESERDFNQITLYGKDTNWKEVLNAARRFPMFSEKLLVILKEAAQMKDIQELLAYVENPNPSTVLVIDHRNKKLAANTKLAKAVNKTGVYFHAQKIKEQELLPWILQYAAAENLRLSAEAAEMLALYLGTDLNKVENEIQKILLNLPDRKAEIGPAEVEKYIGISRDYNPLELPDALFEKDRTRLARMMNYFIANPKALPLPLFMGLLCNFLQGVYLSYFTKANFQQDRALGIWSKHRKIAAQYPLEKIKASVQLLETFSHKSVGIDSANKDDLLKEMIGRFVGLLD